MSSLYPITWMLLPFTAGIAQADEAEMLQLAVEPAKQENILYEPVIVKVTLTNVGDESVDVSPYWNRRFGDLEVFVAVVSDPDLDLEHATAPPASAFRSFHSEFLGVQFERSPPKPLGPGQSRVHAEVVHFDTFNPRSFVIESEGILWIKGRFYYRFVREPRAYVESKPVGVRFKSPRRDLKRPGELVSSPKVGSLVQYGTIATPYPKYRTSRERIKAAAQAKRDLEAIVTEYPDSVYSFYAQLALSKPGKWADVAFEGLRSLAPGAEPNLALVRRAEELVAERERRKRMLFPDDDRLAAQVRYDLVELTPLEELLEVAGKQTKVPLQVGEPLEQKSWIISGRSAADDAALGELLAQLRPDERIFIFRPLKGRAPLREVMKRFLSAGRTWVPHEGGYLLTTTEHARTLQHPQGEDARDSTPAPGGGPRAAPESGAAPSDSAAAATATTSGLHPQEMLLGVLALCTVMLAIALASIFAARN